MKILFLNYFEKYFLYEIISSEIISYENWLKKNNKLKGYSVYLNFESNLKTLEDLQKKLF